MPYPLGDSHDAGDGLVKISADWLNTVARTLNGIKGLNGISFQKTASGLNWRITLDISAVDFADADLTNALDGVSVEMSSGKVAVKPDNVTLEKTAGGLHIKPSGISATEMGSNSVPTAAVQNNAIESGKMDSALYSGNIATATPQTIAVTNGVITGVS